jgi:polysaccharide deacetylase family protein (PEP-CTERM system associated)
MSAGDSYTYSGNDNCATAGDQVTFAELTRQPDTVTGRLPIINAMTVDVEDYFQVSAFEPYIDRATWSSFPSRVERNTDRILQIFSDRGVKATFFTLGSVARQFPAMTRRIVSDGHELASHGWDHIRVTQMEPDEFRSDVARSKRVLEDISGTQILGYRAPSFSINRLRLWAHEILGETGHRYSSSIAPIEHDNYGIPEAPRFAFQSKPSGLLEIPVSTLSIAKRNIAIGGGGWFRFYPYALSRACIRRLNRLEHQPAVFYFHPWEMDPGQPRQTGLDAKTRFRHYVNLRKQDQRIDRLSVEFRWSTMQQVFATQLSELDSVDDLVTTDPVS